MTTKRHHSTNLISDIASTSSLDRALEQVYHKRIRDGADSDIWSLHLYWARERQILQHQLLTGTYQLSPVAVYHANGQHYTRWSSTDRVVLKAIANALTPIISRAVGTSCTHLKGHGGLKGALRSVAAELPAFKHVVRSDVANYYQSITVSTLITACEGIITDRRILNIIQQLIERVEIYHGHYTLNTQGVPKGCALSPLIGALMLKSLGKRLPAGCFFIRYMDDWVILTHTKRQLRRAVKWIHRVMHLNGFKLALNKTFIGKISRGFDFLGYLFNDTGLIGLALKTVLNFNEKLQRASYARVLQYVERWQQWCSAGLRPL